MPESVEIRPVARPIVGSIRPPGSKSLTNRALVCAALATGGSRLTGALDSDDTRVMIESLKRLGIGVDASNDGHALTVHGAGGTIPTATADLFIGNSGTTVRFLTAACTVGRGEYRLDGVPRMRERPIGDLIDALNALGANVRCESPGGCPPVVVNAAGLPGGSATIRGDISSQFLSGLMMAARCASGEITLTVDGELVSKPYVEMTARVMESFGASIDATTGDGSFRIPSGGYLACDYPIEPDASAASYFWAAAAITGGRVTVEGLSKNALQGDVAFVDCLATMGCDVEHTDDSITVVGKPLRGAKLDMNAISDTVQTLAAVALFADGPTEVTGVAHNRHKETDRIGDLAIELRRLGAEVEESLDGLTIHPRPLRAATVETYDDHRMAMSLSLVGLRRPGVQILNPGCTAKTYPAFFNDLDGLAASSR